MDILLDFLVHYSIPAEVAPMMCQVGVPKFEWRVLRITTKYIPGMLNVCYVEKTQERFPACQPAGDMLHSFESFGLARNGPYLQASYKQSTDDGHLITRKASAMTLDEARFWSSKPNLHAVWYAEVPDRILVSHLFLFHVRGGCTKFCFPNLFSGKLVSLSTWMTVVYSYETTQCCTVIR